MDIDNKGQGGVKYSASADSATAHTNSADTASSDTTTAGTSVADTAADNPPRKPFRGGRDDGG